MRCVTCGLVFGAGELRGHQLREHRDEVYRCSCRRPFRTSQDLRRHSRDSGHAISTVYRLPGEEPFEIVPYPDAGAEARAQSRADRGRSQAEDEDVGIVEIVEIHPWELQPPCTCECVDLDLILLIPDEEYPRCFVCAKPLRGRGYKGAEIRWMRVVSKLNWREDPGMRQLPAPFRAGNYTARARSRARRGRSATEGEAAASGLTPEGTAYPSPFAHAAPARPLPVGPPQRGRPVCGRCRRQRPGERIRCLRCQRKVGPGCTPGCLLVELRRVSRERVGLCIDWPHCRSSGDEIAWDQAVSDALFSAESESTSALDDGRATGPARSAFASSRSIIIAIIAFLAWISGLGSRWQGEPVLGASAPSEPLSSHALGLDREVGGSEEKRCCERMRELIDSRECWSFGLLGSALQSSCVDRSQLGSNSFSPAFGFPPQRDWSRFPLYADSLGPVLEIGPDDMSRLAEHGQRDDSVGLNAPLEYTRGGFLLIEPEICHEAPGDAPARFPRQISATGGEPNFSFVLHGDPANCYNANLEGDLHGEVPPPPTCPCVTPFRPEHQRSKARPRVADKHAMYTVRECQRRYHSDDGKGDLTTAFHCWWYRR